MSRLSHTESGFQDYVLGAGTDIVAEIAGGDEEFRRTRLNIYRDAYRLRLIEVLGSDFSALKSYAGDEWFDAIATRYIAAHPSVFRNVRWFGAAFPAFLREQSDQENRPVLADLALFEWTLGLAFDAPVQATTGFADVASVAPEAWPDLRFHAHVSLRVLELGTNAVAIWKSIKGDASDAVPDPATEPVIWAIWRKSLSPYFRSLAPDEAWALSAMREGHSFGEICAGLCDRVPAEEAAPRAAQLLRGWVDEGWIAGLSTSLKP
jgi:hypothetical protein